MPVAFLLKKIITAFLLPQGLLIVALLVFAALAKKLRTSLCILAGLVYLMSIEPTASLVMAPLEYAYAPPVFEQIKGCDAYVVLGGGIREDAPDMDGKGVLPAGALSRAIAAYRLYRVDKKPIILSGGSINRKTTEAATAARFLLSLGVEEKYIVKEGKSVDTFENAQYVKQRADKLGFRRIVLITSAYHMKRSSILFGRHFREIVPFPTDYQTSRETRGILSYLPDAQNLATIQIALREYLGIMYYYWG